MFKYRRVSLNFKWNFTLKELQFDGHFSPVQWWKRNQPLGGMSDPRGNGPTYLIILKTTANQTWQWKILELNGSCLKGKPTNFRIFHGDIWLPDGEQRSNHKSFWHIPFKYTQFVLVKSNFSVEKETCPAVGPIIKHPRIYRNIL